MECIHCRGRLELCTAPFTVERSGYHLRWDAVPAWVCLQCGEPMFEPHVVDLIQKALLALDRESQMLVPAH